LGRDEGTGLLAFPKDIRVSRLHAKLTVLESPWRVTVEDLKSKNGTFVNGRPVESIGLVDGDLIRIGQSFFAVRWRSRPEEPASDIRGRAPAQIKLRSEIDRVDANHRAVLLQGSEGCVFDDLVAAVHRRLNPEGERVRLGADDLTMEALEAALHGSATLVVEGIDRMEAALLERLDGPALAPVIATMRADVDALVQDGQWRKSDSERFDHCIRIPRLVERRDDVLGLLVAALGEGMPPLSIDLIETLLIYNWPGDLVELMEVAMELRVRGAGLDALVTELVSPRLRGRRTASVFSDDSHTQIDVRRPIPSRPDLEGLLTIHDGNVDAVADVLGRSRMQVTAWIQQFDLDPDEG
jgi:DNA-binding NtrC family response regulator